MPRGAEWSRLVPRRAADESWMRRRLPELGLALDVLAGLGLVVGAFLLAGEVVDDDGSLLHPGFVLVCASAGLYGALRGGLGYLSAEPLEADEQKARRRRAARRRTERRVGPTTRVRLLVLVLAVAVASAVGGAALPEEPDLGTGLLAGGGVTLLMSLISAGIGLCAALLLAAMTLVVLGVVMFGSMAVRGRAPDGTVVPRRAAAGPLVACLGLLALPLTLSGVGAYDSPRRRDIWPLVGLVGDDVDVTHPVWLLAAQVATWFMLAGLALGALLQTLSREADGPLERESAGTPRR